MGSASAFANAFRWAVCCHSSRSRWAIKPATLVLAKRGAPWDGAVYQWLIREGGGDEDGVTVPDKELSSVLRSELGGTQIVRPWHMGHPQRHGWRVDGDWQRLSRDVWGGASGFPDPGGDAGLRDAGAASWHLG